MEQVMDISRWQGKIDWERVKASGAVSGVMLRVLGSKGGKPYIDPTFEQNYSACARLGIPVGGYYYTTAVTASMMEAELTYSRPHQHLGHSANGFDLLFTVCNTLDRSIQVGVQVLPHRRAQRVRGRVAAQVILNPAPTVRVLCRDAQRDDVILRDARYAGNMAPSVHGQFVQAQSVARV